MAAHTGKRLWLFADRTSGQLQRNHQSGVPCGRHRHDVIGIGDGRDAVDQPGIFIALDYELFLRFGPNVQAVQVPVVLSTYRMHASSKTVASRDAFVDENWHVREKLFGRGKSFFESVRLRYYFGRAFARYRIERGVWKWREDRRLAEERERNG